MLKNTFSILIFKELPEKWANTKRLTLIAMQQVAPLQTLEVAKLKKKTQNFEFKQNEFRKNFLKMKFFKLKCTQPYDYLGCANKLISELEKDIALHSVSGDILNCNTYFETKAY